MFSHIADGEALGEYVDHTYINTQELNLDTNEPSGGYLEFVQSQPPSRNVKAPMTARPPLQLPLRHPLDQDVTSRQPHWTGDHNVSNTPVKTAIKLDHNNHGKDNTPFTSLSSQGAKSINLGTVRFRELPRLPLSRSISEDEVDVCKVLDELKRGMFKALTIPLMH